VYFPEYILNTSIFCDTFITPISSNLLIRAASLTNYTDFVFHAPRLFACAFRLHVVADASDACGYQHKELTVVPLVKRG